MEIFFGNKNVSAINVTFLCSSLTWCVTRNVCGRQHDAPEIAHRQSQPSRISHSRLTRHKARELQRKAETSDPSSSSSNAVRWHTHRQRGRRSLTKRHLENAEMTDTAGQRISILVNT